MRKISVFHGLIAVAPLKLELGQVDAGGLADVFHGLIAVAPLKRRQWGG